MDQEENGTDVPVILQLSGMSVPCFMRSLSHVVFCTFQGFHYPVTKGVKFRVLFLAFRMGCNVGKAFRHLVEAFYGCEAGTRRFSLSLEIPRNWIYPPSCCR